MRTDTEMIKLITVLFVLLYAGENTILRKMLAINGGNDGGAPIRRKVLNSLFANIGLTPRTRLSGRGALVNCN